MGQRNLPKSSGKWWARLELNQRPASRRQQPYYVTNKLNHLQALKLENATLTDMF